MERVRFERLKISSTTEATVNEGKGAGGGVARFLLSGLVICKVADLLSCLSFA